MTTAAPALLSANALSFGPPAHPLAQPRSFVLAGGVTLVRGDEGTGKSCLLRLLAGDLAPTGGDATLAGLSLQRDGAAWRRAVAWHDPAAPWDEQMRPQDLFAGLPARFETFSAEALDDLVDGFGLAPHREKAFFMLSAGTRRKVLLAASLAAGTPLTLIDEPFAALDKASVVFLRELLADMAGHPRRAWLVADYAAPAGVPLAGVIDLDQPPAAG